MSDTKAEKLYYDPLSIAKRTNQIVHFVEEYDKVAMLTQIINNYNSNKIVVITKNKRKADELSEFLKEKEFKATAIHGNHRKEEHLNVAKAFNLSELNVIITTDMILQTLNLTSVELVISYDLPLKSDTYFLRLEHLKEVGDAVSLVSEDDESLLDTIEHVMKLDIAKEEVKDFTPQAKDEEHEVKKHIKNKKKKPRHTAQRKRKDKLKKENLDI